MLKFFRQIRKRLLESGKIKSYSFYAIGEITLVVIGILIALQINNWNEQRKRSLTELKILKEISSDLEETLNEIKIDLNGHIYFMNEGKKFKALLLEEDPDQDSLGHHFRLLSRDLQVYPKSGGLDFLESKGLDLISNDSLRTMITDFYELDISRLQIHGRNNSNTDINNLLFQYEKKHFSLSETSYNKPQLESQDRLGNQFLLYEYQLRSIESLKSDTEFFMSLQRSFWLRNSKIYLHENALKNGEGVLAHIYQEIAQME